MLVRFDQEKAKIIKENRNIDLCIVSNMIKTGEVLGVSPNKTRENQVDFYLMYNKYPIAVPCAIEENGYFIRTAFHDRRLVKKFGKGE